jgi:hypothetical protein
VKHVGLLKSNERINKKTYNDEKDINGKFRRNGFPYR